MSLVRHDLLVSLGIYVLKREGLTPSHAPPATRILSSPPSLYLAASSAISCRSWNRCAGSMDGSCTQSIS